MHATKHTTKQEIDHTIKQSINQAIKPSIKPSTNLSYKQAFCVTNNQPTNHEERSTQANAQSIK